MVRRFLAMLLPVLALSTALLGERASALQEEAIPGVAFETLGRSPVGDEGDELVLLRVTIEPGAGVPASDGPRAFDAIQSRDSINAYVFVGNPAAS